MWVQSQLDAILRQYFRISTSLPYGDGDLSACPTIVLSDPYAIVLKNSPTSPLA